MESFEKLIQENEARAMKGIVFQTFDEPDGLQRTDEWFEQRRGKFTGSEIKKLMSCSRAKARAPWGTPEKTIDFSDTAIKYIFSKAMECKRKKYIKTPETAAMRYGKEMEDASLELFLYDNPQFSHTEVGFIEFLPGIAGSSPDGKIKDDLTGEIFAFENKCPTNWGTFYDRKKSVHEKHIDFWQVQAEMLSLKAKRCIYLAAEPAENMFDPEITDYEWQTVEASTLHQSEIIHRCKIGDAAIILFLQGADIEDAIFQAARNYEF